MKVLITGATSGIGNEIASQLLKKGYFVYLCVHSDNQVKMVKDKYKDNNHLCCFKLDITSEEDRNLLNELDIDILINNAAICEGGSVAEIPMNVVRNNFEVNVFSTFELVQLVLKKMIEKNKGRIIVIGSLAGLIPMSFIGSYCATKAAVISMTTCLKKEIELLNSNVKIVLIEPGLYYTGFNHVMFENKYDRMDESSYFYNYIPYLQNKEEKMLKLFECKKLDGIVKKVVKACEKENPSFIYRAPFYQVLAAKIYMLLKK